MSTKDSKQRKNGGEKLGKRQRRRIETAALRIDLKESIFIFISVLSTFLPDEIKISDRFSSRFLVTRRIFISTFDITFSHGKNSVSKELISFSKKARTGGRIQNGQNVSRGGDFTRRFFSRLPVSQSVSQSIFRRGKWWRDVDIVGSVGGEEMGCQRLVRVSSWLCDEARVASVFSRLYHGMREGRGGGVDPGPGSRTGVMDTRARGGGSLSHIKYTRGGSSPRCHPSTRSSTCGLPSRAYRASPTIFFPPFPSLETYPFRFYLSLSPNPSSLSLSSSLLASFPPRYYSSFAPRASSLCFFVPFAASSPFLPTLSVSLKTSPKTLLESSSASFFPSSSPFSSRPLVAPLHSPLPLSRSFDRVYFVSR